MSIEEAIELIQADLDDEDIDWDSPLGRAYELSFEALKSVRTGRKVGLHYEAKCLPGETKD